MHIDLIKLVNFFLFTLCSVMAFMIGLPVGQIVLFCLAIGRDPTGLTLAVTNHELSSEFLSQQECPVSRGCNRTLLSCRYLDTLKKRNNLILVRALTFAKLFDFQCGHSSLQLYRLSRCHCHFTSNLHSNKNVFLNHSKNFSNLYSLQRHMETEEEAIALVKKGKAWGSLVFSSNYSEALNERFENPNTDDANIDSSLLEVKLDMSSESRMGFSPAKEFSICQFQFFNTKKTQLFSDQQIGTLLNRDIQFAYFDFVEKFMTECDINPKNGKVPITFEQPIYGTLDPNFTDFAAPGVQLT